jgi:hypothetical protein
MLSYTTCHLAKQFLKALEELKVRSKLFKVKNAIPVVALIIMIQIAR